MVTINGDNGDNLIDRSGATTDDSINGKSGDDTILGGSGNEDIDGGSGDDVIDGGDGNDTIQGGSGHDMIDGGDGADDIRGLSGDDTIDGGAGDDTIDGGAGDDMINAGTGDDLIDAGSGNDTVDAGSGDDTIEAGSGADLVEGGAGNDVIDGEAGDDTMAGGAGDDTLEGGPGNDTAVFAGSIVDFAITDNGTTFTVDDQNAADGDEGTDTVDDDIETLLFDDYTLDLTGGNNAPIALVGTKTTDEQTVLGFGLRVLDFDGDAITLDSISVPVGGTISVVSGPTPGSTGLGSATDFGIEFDPNGAYETLGVGDSLTETVTVTSSDANGATTVQTFFLVITGVNDAPVAADDAFSGDEDTVISGNVLTNDSDVDGDSLTAAIVSGPTNGTVTLNLDGSFDYTPNADFNGADSFTYEASDGNGGTDTATVSLTVNAVNDAPVAVDDAFSGDEDTVISGNVLTNDSDVDGDSLTATLVTGAANGTVTLNLDGSFDYTPNANFNGADSFTYEASDGNGGATQATVTITVDPVNDAPQTDAPNDPTVLVDEADGLASIDLLARSSDVDGDNLTIATARLIAADTQIPLGVEVNVAGGIATFNPADLGLNNGETLNAQLSFIVRDDSGAPNNTANGLVDVVITGADDPPPPANTAPTAALIDLSATTYLEAAGPFTIDLAPFIADAETPDAGISVIALFGTEGEVDFTQSGTDLIIDPEVFGLNTGQTVAFDLTYVIDDGSGAPNSTAENRILFSVEGEDEGAPPANDPPVAGDLSVTVDEADGVFSIDLSTLVSDPNPGDLLAITDATSASALVFELAGDTLIIDPASLGLDDSQSATVTITYQVKDNSGQANSTASGVVTLTVNGADGPDPEPVAEVLDFEQFADPDGLSINITNEPYRGLVFEGSATVIETDEIDGGRGPNGIQLGQTTEGGHNVLVGTFITTNEQVVDGNGDPVFDERGDPVFEEVIDQLFSGYSAGSTYRIEDDAVNLGTFSNSDPPPELPTEPDNLGLFVGSPFSLDGLSLNMASGGATNVTIKTYAVEVLGEPFSSTLTTYSYDFVEQDTFVFSVDSTTAALQLDFNAADFADSLGNANSAAFDGIFAFEVTSANDAGIVFDDIFVTI